MNFGAILFFIFGVVVLWGGFAYTLYVALKHKENS